MPGENTSQKISDEPLSKKPVVFLLLDGWGVAPEGEGNAIGKGNSKKFAKLLTEYPASVLRIEEKGEAKRYQLLGGNGAFAKELSRLGLSQSYLMESEKAAAVLGFLVGAENVERISYQVISSPVCESYELEPAMSLEELSRVAVKTIREGNFDFLLISLANLEAVAASGNLEATKKAVAKVDAFLGKIAEEVLIKKGILLISSSAGHAERMVDIRTELVDKENTLNPVPLVLVGEEFKGRSLFGNDAPGGDLSLLEPIGALEDLPKTIFGLLELAESASIEGNSLLSE